MNTGFGAGKAWLAAFALAACGFAQAQPSPALDRISFWIGGSNLDTDATLEASSFDPPEHGKLDLGRGNQSITRARLDLLLFDSQGFTFDFYSLSRSKDRRYDGQFRFQGIPFDLAANLRTDFEVDLGSAAWRWWFGSGADVFGIGLGGAYYRVKLDLQGTAHIDEQSVSAHERWSDTAVAPVVTLAYKHAFSDSLRLYMDANGLKKNGGPLNGHIYDVRAGLEWFPWAHLGLSAEYGKSKLSLRREREQYSAAFNSDFHGPSVFARLRF
jgi:hypothetical protein